VKIFVCEYIDTSEQEGRIGLEPNTLGPHRLGAQYLRDASAWSPILKGRIGSVGTTIEL